MQSAAFAQTLSIVSGNSQTLSVGSTSLAPLVVTICQPGEVGCGRFSTNIVFQIQAPSSKYATLCSSTTSCDGNSLTVETSLEGNASAYITAGAAPGNYTVTATIQSTTTSVTFSVTNVAGPPGIVSVQQEFQGYQGQPISIEVGVYDGFYNPIPGPYPVTFTAPSTEPSGTFGGSRTTTLQVMNGFVTAMLTPDNVSGTFNLQINVSCMGCSEAIPITVLPNVNITFNTNPAGLAFSVNGQTYQSSKTLSLAPTSQHTLSASSPQTTASGIWAFSNWSQPTNNGVFTVPMSDETVTANFQAAGAVQYLLSASASPPSQGSLSVSPQAADGSYSDGTYSGHYNAGTVVQITATPASGYVFLKFEGAVSSTANPVSVTINSQTDLTAIFAPAIPTTIATSPSGLSISVDGQQYTAPQIFQWTQMSQHTISTNSPQTNVSGRFTFANWSDAGPISHTIVVGAAAATYTANFTQTSSAPSLNCGSGGAAQVGASFSLSCTASGGSSPYTFSLSSGSLPPGLSLTSQGATATISGSPTSAGSYSFTVQVADSGTPALTATQTVSITVTQVSATLSVSPPGLTFSAYQGRSNPPSQSLQVSSSSAVIFSITNVPGWLTVTPTRGSTPAVISVAVNANLLGAGATNGTISIAPANGQAETVTVQATVNPFSIGASSPVNVSLAAGTTTSGTLAVTTVDNGPASVQAAASTATGGNWLTLAPATLSAPGPLNYTVDATSLAAGNYTGTIALSCTSANPCAQVPVTVNLTVTQNTTVTISQVLNATGEAPLISQNTWIEIKGTNLSQTKRIWQASDFDPATGLMPTELDGVSATVDGKPAYVYYISPTQANVLTPLDTALGPVAVVVKNGVGTSAPATVTMLPNSLGFFAFNSGQYAAATHANGALLGPTTLFPGQSTPAAPGETIVLYGNGFGQITPAINPGAAAQAGVLPYNPTITIGGLPATVLYAAAVSPGLYQFNVEVPPNAQNGDLALLATYNGVSTQQGVVITVSH
jgi:uncharacterized protein (TIGR03437 family)